MPPTEGKRIGASLVAQCWSCSWKARPYRRRLTTWRSAAVGKGVHSAMAAGLSAGDDPFRAGTLNFYSFTRGGFVTGTITSGGRQPPTAINLDEPSG
jgi:hypothetical protein